MTFGIDVFGSPVRVYEADDSTVSRIFPRHYDMISNTYKRVPKLSYLKSSGPTKYGGVTALVQGRQIGKTGRYDNQTIKEEYMGGPFGGSSWEVKGKSGYDAIVELELDSKGGWGGKGHINLCKWDGKKCDQSIGTAASSSQVKTITQGSNGKIRVKLSSPSHKIKYSKRGITIKTSEGTWKRKKKLSNKPKVSSMTARLVDFTKQ